MPENETPVTDSPETPTETAAPATGEKDWKAEAEKWKGFARKHEDQAKANADAAKRLQEIEDAAKSEAQRLAERAEKAEKALAAAEVARMRAEVAAERGVPANLLAGSTLEELTASADALVAFRGQVPAGPPADGLGNVGKPIGDGKGQLTRADLARMSPFEIDAAREKGLLSDVLSGKA